MPKSPGSEATQALSEEKSPPFRNKLSSGQKITLIGFTLTTAGYAAFTDAISFIFLVQPIRSEYQFEEMISAEKWLAISAALAGTYGFYTLTCEGKGSYDALKEYFLRYNQKKYGLPPERVFVEDPLPALPQDGMTAPRTCHQKLVYGSIRTAAAMIALVGSLSDSAETTMGLVGTGATLTKTIAISSLSFLSAISFYGPITWEAFEELFLGIPSNEEPAPTHTLAKVIGYPMALCSALQDTLECGASLFDNFSVTNNSSRWAIVCVSSLGGVSSLCLEGKRGVEVLEHFLTQLETRYAWLPRTLFCDTPLSRKQVYELCYDVSILGLSTYAASYIALADKDLTLSLSKSILKTLGIEVPMIPQLLGWGAVLKDIVIQTSALSKLIRMALQATHQAFVGVRESCCATEPVALDDLPEMEEVELAVLGGRGEEADEEEDLCTEDTALLSQNRQRKMEEDEAEKEGGFLRFFPGRQRRNARRESLKPEKGTCLVM